jgi:hypothetical protein
MGIHQNKYTSIVKQYALKKSKQGMKPTISQECVPKGDTIVNAMNTQPIWNVYEHHVYTSPNIEAINQIDILQGNIFHPLVEGFKFWQDLLM